MYAKQTIGFLAARPLASLGVFALIGASLIVAEVYQVVSDVRYRTALEAATSYSDAVSSVREYYSSEVVPRARLAGVKTSHEFRDVEGAIPLPATLTIELGEQTSAHRSGGTFRLFSDHPFTWRTDGGPRNDLEREALNVLQSGEAEEFIATEKIGDQSFLHYAIPVRMKESCVECHNNHPQSIRKDWRVGDVRGVQSVRLPIPGLLQMLRVSGFNTFAFTIVGTLGGILVLALLLRHLQGTLEEQRRLVELAESRNLELSNAKVTAEAANRSKTDFLANMSHELRTPLHAIIGFSEIIKGEKAGPIDNEKHRDYAKEIHDSGHSLLVLINDILDLSRIENGTDELREEEVVISGVIQSAMKLVQHQAQQKNIELELQIHDETEVLYVDERKVKQILSNLLINAIKFTEPGGKVTLKAGRDTDCDYVFEIIDTGIGIAPEDIPRALSRFGQVDGDRNRKHEGTGLGLPLVKSLIEQHGGSFDLQSEVGAGTTARVSLPTSRILGSPTETVEAIGLGSSNPI